MNVSFAGFGENIATFETAAAIPAGTPVKMSANGTVAACAAGDAFIGIAVSQRGDFVGVQLKGYRNAAVTGSIPVGWARRDHQHVDARGVLSGRFHASGAVGHQLGPAYRYASGYRCITIAL